jgi:hypothetical protein
MDFEIGNVIYIIATIVAIAVGLLSKKKKPAGTGAPVSSEPEKKPGIFDALGKEMESFLESKRMYDGIEVDSEVDSDIEFESLEEAAAPIEEVPFQSEYKGMLNSEMKANYNRIISDGSMDMPMEIIDLEGDEEPDFFDIDKEFDLKSAIIYSAIINRIEY